MAPGSVVALDDQWEETSHIVHLGAFPVSGHGEGEALAPRAQRQLKVHSLQLHADGSKCNFTPPHARGGERAVEQDVCENPPGALQL